MEPFGELFRLMTGALVFIAIVVIGMRLLAGLLRSGLGESRRPRVAMGHEFPYRRRDALFTPTEASFLSALDAAIGATHRVFGKVRLADLIEVEPRLGGGGWRAAFNRISAKHVDFVVCHPGTLQVVAAIELDDASHQARDRMQRDRFVESAFDAADLKLVRVGVRPAYDVEALRAAVLGEHSIPVQIDAVVSRVDDGLVAPRSTSGPPCPVCRGSMVRRSVRRGAAGHQEYYECEVAPVCPGRLPARQP